MEPTFVVLEPVLREAGVVVAYLFGSRAKGTASERSDADVAVLTEDRLTLRSRARLARRLAEGLGVTDVDVVLITEAPLELRGRIVQEGRLIYSADEARRVAFEVRTRSEYLDFLPTLEAHRERYLRRVAERGL